MNGDVGAPGEAGEAERDVAGAEVAPSSLVLLVVITAGSSAMDSSMMKSSGSTSWSGVHVHCAASSKMMSRLMWTRRVAGS